jgi:hypothetical protein
MGQIVNRQSTGYQQLYQQGFQQLIGGFLGAGGRFSTGYPQLIDGF